LDKWAKQKETNTIIVTWGRLCSSWQGQVGFWLGLDWVRVNFGLVRLGLGLSWVRLGLGLSWVGLG
jgi:hypothetical protein